MKQVSNDQQLLGSAKIGPNAMSLSQQKAVIYVPTVEEGEFLCVTSTGVPMSTNRSQNSC